MGKVRITFKDDASQEHLVATGDEDLNYNGPKGRKFDNVVWSDGFVDRYPCYTEDGIFSFIVLEEGLND